MLFDLATLAFFVYQKPSLETVMSIIRLATNSRRPWNLMPENRDALIDRARSIAATRWLTKTQDDVLVMSDDDFGFHPEGLNALADLAISKQCIAVAVTPLKSGEYTTIVPLPVKIDVTHLGSTGPEYVYVDNSGEPWRDPHSEPQRIRWGGGLMAFHRSVFEAIITEMRLPLLHKDDVIEPFYPFFMPMIYEHETDGMIYLSEDYACQERASISGKSTWVQPACQVGHLANNMMVTVQNMDRIAKLYS